MSDRMANELLFGVLAFQAQLITESALRSAVEELSGGGSDKTLADILVEQQAITPEVRAALESLVAAHVQQHADDPEKSLAALSSVSALVQDLWIKIDPDHTLAYQTSPESAAANESGEEGSQSQRSRGSKSGPSATDPETLERIDKQVDQYEDHWDQHGCPRLDAFLAEWSGPHQDELFRQLLLSELHRLRMQQNRDIAKEEYLKRFPQFEPVVQEVFRGETLHDGSPRRFRILKRHAAGGLGVVYSALDQELGREVALKEILPGKEDVPALKRRFRLEAEITGGLEHPGIVPIYSLGRYQDDRPFYAMRFIEGDNLKDAIEQFHTPTQSASEEPTTVTRSVSEESSQPLVSQTLTTSDPRSSSSPFSTSNLQFRDLLGRFVDVCQAIAYAHSRDVLHRDLKPANVMLGKFGETLVIDWGLAKRLRKTSDSLPMNDDGSQESLLHPAIAETHGQSIVGRDVLGSLQYMSPEQANARHDELGPATDVFSLGAILFHILTGRAPIGADLTTDELDRLRKNRTAHDLALHKRASQGTFPAPRQLRPDVPAALEAVCLKAMSVRADARYESAQLLAKDIERWLADEPVSVWREPFSIRAQRWMKQHRTAVATTAAMFLMSFLGLFGWGLLVAKHTHEVESKNTALEKANSKEREATDAAKRQTKLAQRNLYVARIRLATNYWDKNDIGVMNQALESCRPEPELPDQRGWEWNYLWNFSHSERLTLKGHSSGVACVAFSPDGNRIVSGSRDKTLKIWDAESGRELFTLRGHEHPVTSVAYSPDGRSIVSGGGDSHFLLSVGVPGNTGGSLKVWNAENGQERLALKGHEHEVTSVGFSPDGKRIVSGSGKHIPLGVVEGSIKVWDVESGVELLSLKQIASGIRSVSFSPDGKEIVAGIAVSNVVVSGLGFGGSTDATLKVWNALSGAERLSSKGHLLDVLSTAYSPSGQHIATGSKDKRIRVWDSESGQEILMLNGHTGEVNGVSFSPDGRRIVSGSDDKTLAVWDAPGEIPDALKGKAEAAMYHFTRSLRNRAGLLKVAEEKSEEELFTLKGHTEGVTSVAFSPDGKRIISGSNDTTVKVWDNVSGQGALTLERANGSGSSVCFSPDGKRIVSGGTDKSLKVWDTESGQIILILAGHSGGVNSVSYSPDGKWIVSGSDDSTLKVWDAKAGQEKFSLTGHAGSVRSVCFSPDGKWIVSESSDRSLKVWDTESRHEIATFHGHEGQVRSVSISPDGKRIAIGSKDRSVTVWDVNNGEAVLALNELSGEVDSICFSLDGKRSVANSGDSQHVWNSENGHYGKSVSFSPDGKRIVSGGSDSVKVWDAESGEVMLTLKSKQSVESVCFSPDGKLIASGHYGAVRVWDGRPESESPDRVIEREARYALTFHREKMTSRENLANALRNDATLTTPARQKALVWVTAVLLDEDAKALNNAAWQVVSKPDQPMDQYHVALHRAETARLIKHDVYYDGTLGVAQYRVGQYEESQRTLALVVAEQGFIAFGHHPHPADVAFLAMVEHKLGHLDEARAWLDQLREIMKQPKWEKDNEVKAIFHEAQLLLEVSFYQKGQEIGQTLDAEAPTDKEAQRDRSFSYNKLGDESLQSGHVAEALGFYQKGLAIIQKLAAADPTDAQIQRDLSVSYDKLGDVNLQAGHVVEALEHYQKLLQISQKLAKMNPRDAQAQRDLSVSYNKLGNVNFQVGKVAEAFGFYQKDLELSRQRAADPADAQAQRDLSVSYNNLGDVSIQVGQVAEALEFYQKGLEISRKLSAASPADVQTQRDLSVLYDRVGDVNLQAGQTADALTHYQNGLEIRQKLAAAAPNDAQAQRDLSVSYDKLGDMSLQNAQIAAALGHFQKGLKIRQEQVAKDPTDARAQSDLSVSYDRLGDVSRQLGQATEALEHYSQGLEIRQQQAAMAPTNASAQSSLVVSFVKLGSTNQQLKDNEKAIMWFQQALDVLEHLEKTGQLPPSKKEWIAIVKKAIMECQKQIPNDKKL